MAVGESRIGPASRVLAANIKRVREGMRLSYAGLSRRLAIIGQPIPELGLRRIEKGERRVDVDDLLALCLVLGISPVDLLVSKDVDADQWYQVAPKATAMARNVSEWVRGEDVLFYRTDPDDPEPPFDPADLLNPTRWMPADRAARALLRHIKELEEQGERDGEQK
jgi:transcriptional regulator with XRE-family HTH domain